MSGVRVATADDLAHWDASTVDGPGGQVLQSRAWAEHRRATGWRPSFLVAPDGAYVLALSRPWPIVGGGSAYVPRGPVPDVDDAERLARRLVAVADHLAAQDIDVVASDAEVPADGGYREAIRRRAFAQIEEIQPSRHTMVIPLGPGADEAAVHAAIAKQTRARIRSAERAGIQVRRYDARSPDRPLEEARHALDVFFDLETAMAERRRFTLGPRRLFLDWWEAALRAGHLVYLEALGPGVPTVPLGGIVLYRHGRRLSTVQSADRVEERRSRPGILHLLRWRAIQQAIREGCAVMDLGGADVAGARRPPRPGEPMYGLYEHKSSFGARWVEMTGAHERVYRPRRYAAGRIAARLRRIGVGR